MSQSITGSGPNYISLGSSVTLPATTGTIGMWFYPTWSHTDGTERSLFDVRNAGSNNYFTINKFSSNSTYTGWLTSGVDYRIVTTSGTASFTQNAWNWVAYSWETTSMSEKSRVTMNSYQNAVDGVTVTTWNTSGRDVQIGNLSGGDKPATARIAELAIWNRVVPQADLLSIYNSRLSPRYYLQGLQLYIPMIRSIVDRVNKLSASISTTGTVSVADHCPVIYPYGAFAAKSGSTGGGAVGPWPFHMDNDLSGGLYSMGL